MDLHGKSILILGGSGLVGQAVARRVLRHEPRQITLVALAADEVAAAAAALEPVAGRTAIAAEWGNVFQPVAAAQRSFAEVLEDDALRRQVVEDVVGDLDRELLQRSFLYQVIQRARPDAVVDCINTATAFAYQNVFDSQRRLRSAAPAIAPELVDWHILATPLPQLIRHVQILAEAMREAGTQAYVKVGTSGTGGMGLNVPYTHSEERPSRQLLAKAAVAGAQSLLLFLMARTPGAPAVVEIKPTAAIAWREIAYGPVWRRGKPIPLSDCPSPLDAGEAFGPRAAGWRATGRVLESVFADVGENGLFAREEFETVSALGQMEFITPEEVAEYVVMELEGRPTGRDIVSALDAATAGPTYRAGVLRAAALERLARLEAEHGVRSVAFEMLGPPRLSKNLYEGYLLSRVCASPRALAACAPDDLSRRLVQLVADDSTLRSTVISVGLPILLPGEKVYRGDDVIIWPEDGNLDRAAQRGWVDVREANCGVWIARAERVVEQAAQRSGATGSGAEWDAMDPDRPISPARFATWIFRYEESGERIKR